MESDDFLYSLTSMRSVDLFPDTTEDFMSDVVPLPCWYRGRPKVSLNEMPLFQVLKKQMEETPEQFDRVAAPSGIGRGRPPTSASEEEDVIGSYGRRQTPLRAPTFSSASESLSSAIASSEVQPVPPTSQVPRSSNKPSSRLGWPAKESPAQRPSSKRHKRRSKKGKQVSSASRAESSAAGGKAARSMPTKWRSFKPEHFRPPDSLDSWVASLSRTRLHDEGSNSDEDEGEG